MILETLRHWRRGRISLRTRITAAFTILVVGGTAVSTLIGSRIITNALIEDAQSRAVHGLDAALIMYGESMTTTAEAVTLVAASRAVAESLRSPAAAAEPAIPQLAAEARLDFFRLAGDSASDPCLAAASLRTLVARAASGETAQGADVLPADCLAFLDPTLPSRAYIPAASGDAVRPDVTAALVLVAAVPVGPPGRPRGAAYGGILLNRRNEIVDRVKLLAYGDAQYEGRQIGSASIFLGDVRIATSARTADNARAIGTQAWDVVSRSVLGSGRRWHGRALVVDDWCIAAYEPLRNAAGEVIGMLYVGMLEAPILAVRTNVMLTFLLVCVIGLAIVFALTYLITRKTISPLEEMVAATKRIAAGDMGVRVSVASDDEIGDLAGSFNEMLSSLEATKRELEEWGHTLADKVRERTEELATVQAQMARSEKLASIGRLAAGVAHSINNPLGGILSLSMLGVEECRDPTLRADLETIAKQALRCREIVKGLLDFSRQSDARVSRTDVNAAIDTSLQLLQRQAVLHNVSVVRRFDPDLPAVLVNPSQLQDALTNLIVNAVDAMEEGGTLTLETERRGDEAVVRIVDTGCGIPEQNMPYLFEPFFTTKRVGRGTGLGLSIVHGVITRAGGRIEVQSSTAGTTFTVHMPAAPPGAGEEADHALAGAGSREFAGRS